MQMRHHLEKWLEQAIKEEDLATVKRAVNSIEDDHKAKLDSCDDDGRSFLAQALVLEKEEIILFLMDKFKDNPAVILKKDKKGRTLLSYAAEKNYTEILQQLIVLVRKNDSTLWLEADNDGCLPLHYSTRSGNDEATRILTNEIVKDRTKISDALNRTEVNGDTPLHFMCNNRSLSPNPQLIAYFINQGANVKIANNESIKPIDLIFKLPAEIHFAIFGALEEKSKKELLVLYKEKLLTAAAPPPELKRIYYQFTAQTNLLSLLFARHDFDERMPIRDSYKQINSDNKVVDMLIPEEIGREMPVYMQKVFKATEDLDNKQPNEADPDENWVEINVSMPKDVSECVNQDRETLTSLITDIEVYLTGLQNRPNGNYTIPARSLAVLLPTLSTAAFVLMEVWLWKTSSDLTDEARKYPYTDPRRDALSAQSINYFFGAIFSSLFGSPPLLLANGALAQFLWNKQKNISPAEWIPLVTMLQNDVVQKLEQLGKLENKEKEVDQNASLLPTSTATLNSLKNEITKLNNRQPTSSATVVLTQIKTILETIRKELNQTNKPFTLFKKPKEHVAISVTKEVDENSELLPKPAKPVRRCGIQ